MYYCNRVVVNAPCKINLALDVTGEREGYHLLESVMVSVDLCDVLVIGRRPDELLRVTCSHPALPENDSNIAHKAARAFFAATGLPAQGLSIHIDKSIPMEAGLAGGSTDAAAVLRGLDRLFETSLTDEQLCEIGLEVGSDVPFCVKGGCMLARGTGELLTALEPLPDCKIIIVKPQSGMSTRYAFKLYDDYPGDIGRPDIKTMIAAIAAGDLAAIGRSMINVFEQVSPTDETEMLKGIMLCDGAAGAVLSGTGSAVVGLFADEKDAKTCLRHLKEQNQEAFLTKPVSAGASVIHIS